MNEEQKAIAEEIFYMFDQEHITPIDALTAMAALLQELIDAPEPEPVARVTGYYAGYLSTTVDGRVLSTGTALYTAPKLTKLSDERILEIAMSDDVSLIEDQGPGARPRITVHNSIGGVYAFARAIEREILGGSEK